MDLILSKEETRVLGCLIEKKMATPEYYPLSLNALVNACNQKSNRYPVVIYDEETVLHAIDGLAKKQLIWKSSTGRVLKYEESFIKDRNLNNQEAAALCVLMLRGPQTAGEIRNRTERLFAFEGLEQVIATLDSLSSLDLVARLSRRPGHKEARFSHLMSGKPEDRHADAAASIMHEAMHEAGNLAAHAEQLRSIEEKVESLSQELEELKQMFLDFQRQFE